MTTYNWSTVTPWEGAVMPATAFAMAALRAAVYAGFPPRPPGIPPRPAGLAPGPAGFAPRPPGFAPRPAGFAPRSSRLRRSGRRVGSRRCGGRHLDVEHEARVLKQLGRGSQLRFGHAAGIARIDRDEGRNHESEFILQERLGAEDRCRR